ncbi:hypothetical protein POTOM_034536 [Populus tomentosa]|uniref:Leucine-rich repeat-containing N-terminal plant-type domain-containing protein n=1 Tax=Populus tomentosa TaxID=118781 RepID=A0A8X7Z2C0_POPTO|nr:hypothetical protein POTOM_034536 [Populus tomentosa]
MAPLYLLSIFLSLLISIPRSLSANSEENMWLGLLVSELVVSWLLFVWGVSGNALQGLRSRLSDPTNALQSWDPALVNPCTWFHVTCDSKNHVTRLDLGNSNISGTLGPELGQLKHLKYLYAILSPFALIFKDYILLPVMMELYRNDIGGKIPKELGNLKNLVSMDMYGNKFEGEIPKSFAKLKSLVFLRLNNNKLSGSIPRELATLKDLKVFDVSNNDLCGTIPVDGPFASFPMESYQHCFNQSHGDASTPASGLVQLLNNTNTMLHASFANNRLNGPELKGLVPYDFGC